MHAIRLSAPDASEMSENYKTWRQWRVEGRQKAFKNFDFPLFGLPASPTIIAFSSANA